MQVFHYHPDTGEFIGQSAARPNPLEAGRFLVPRHATTQEVPKGEPDQVAVYEAGQWVARPDFRGVIYWTREGEERQIAQIGETVPADALDAPPDLPAPPPDLSPAQFAYMLALSGFGDVWDAMERAALDAKERQTFATLKAEKARTRYRLDRTLAMVAAMADQAAAVAPEVDLSADAITAAWYHAADYKGAAA